MAADRASQHNCAACGQISEGLLGTHLCSHCGRPQPVALKSDTYFAALGVPQRLTQDPVTLEKNFYAISRALHPDRFSTAPPEARQASVERMTLVNDAYRILKDPATRRAYFLELSGEAPENRKNAQIPMELAEQWFEAQDALSEGNTDSALAKLGAFESELEALKARTHEELAELEREIDGALDRADSAGSTQNDLRPLYARFKAQLQSQTYLRSMTQDLERIKKRLNQS